MLTALLVTDPRPGAEVGPHLEIDTQTFTV
jgi:hypothetical protein